MLVYLRARQEARLESTMSQKSGLMRGNLTGVAKALEAGERYLAADLWEKNIRVNAISAGPVNC